MITLSVSPVWSISVMPVWRRKWQPTLVFFPGESQGRGAWWAAVYGVAQSQTRLKQLSSTSSSSDACDYNFLVSYPDISSVQFSHSVVSDFCDPMNCSTPGLPVHHQLLEFTQTHVHRVSDAIQPSHPLSSPSSPAPNPSQH